ncbi:SH3 domain-containing protein [Mesorhizobium sp. Mes31]|uniref:SH3 domain-containing protein n=1 Tax=Mesorhizobium sp. Mes31 TaxID=2926017 RepID=UPI0021178999|nr:SH3 domain-containing protein [Mesorhizobium sp. Mes31]
MMRRTVTLRTTLHALIAAPLLMAASPIIAPALAEEAQDIVISIVTGLAPNDLLNVRVAASAIAKVEMRLDAGASVTNLGCNDVNGHKWCKIAATDNPKLSGWAPARYLIPLNPATYVEAADGSAAASSQPAPALPPDLSARLGGEGQAVSESPMKSAAITAMQDAYGLALAANETPPTGEIQDPAPAQPQDAAALASGAVEIPCARYVGQPMTGCQASVTRNGSDKADVTVTWPDGGTRIISFSAGLPTGSNADSDFRFTREGSLNMIRVGVSERFEIPDAVAFGD